MSIKPVVFANKVRPDKVVEALKSLQSPNRLPITAIENAVLSVNGKTGHVIIDQSGTMTQVNADWNAVSGPGQILNKPTIPTIEYPVKSVNGKTGLITLSSDDVGAAQKSHHHNMNDVDGLMPAMSQKMDIGAKIQASQIEDMPTIPAEQVNSDWNSVSGKSQILNKPNLFSGNYSDLKGSPNLSSVATSGSYLDLKEQPIIFDGNYNSLTNKPSIPAPQVNADWLANTGISQILNKPVLFSGSYLDLTEKPILFSGNYSDLTNKPNIPAAQIQSDWNQNNSGSPDFIKNKPTIPVINYPVTSVNGKTGSVVITSSDTGSAPALHNHSISEITGLQSTLDNKISVGSAIPYSNLVGTPSIPTNNAFSFVGLNDTDNVINNLGYLKWNSSGTSVQYDTTIPYSVLTGTPTIPTNTNQLTNGAGFVTSSQSAASSPVQSVNGKIGNIVLTPADIGAASSGSIPTNNIFSFKGLNDTDDVAVNNGFLRWNSAGTSISYSTTIPYSSLAGAPVLATVATTGSYADLSNKPILFSGSYNDLTNKPTLFDGTWTSLTGKPTFATVATSGSYIDLTNKPVIPTNVSAFTNDSGYLTSVPVQSVNTKTGAVILSSTDVGAAPTAQGTRYFRQNGTQLSGVKVKYYSVTSDANGAWSLNLGPDFSEILDVQATASSSSGITGVRQASINSYVSNATSLSGNTWGNSVLVTVLISGTNSLALTPNTVVKIRVEGL